LYISNFIIIDTYNEQQKYFKARLAECVKRPGLNTYRKINLKEVAFKDTAGTPAEPNKFTFKTK
jgi:hypothetical protein